MGRLPLFDLVLSSAGPANGCQTKDAAVIRVAAVAECMVTSLLTDLTHLRGLEACLSPECPADVDRDTSDSLRALYEQWVRDADAALERVGRAEHLGATVGAAESLRDEVTRERALLEVTRDDVERARREFRAGRSFTLEEVRRELGRGL